MKLYGTCRLCKRLSYETPNRPMVRYGARHWAHWDCAIERFGFEAFIQKLRPAQVIRIPFQLVKDYPEREAFLRSQLGVLAE